MDYISYMARGTTNEGALPPRTRKLLEQMGQQLRLARVKRGLTEVEMADRMMVSRQTVRRLESGEPSVGLRVLASALHVLGLESNLSLLADPGADRAALARDIERSAPRRRTAKAAPDDDFDLKF